MFLSGKTNKNPIRGDSTFPRIQAADSEVGKAQSG